MAGLTRGQVEERLRDLPGWKLAADGMIERTWKLKDFQAAMAFVNEVAKLAEQANHHPDILVSYSQVTFRLTSHDVGALTERDLSLAARIDRTAPR